MVNSEWLSAIGLIGPIGLIEVDDLRFTIHELETTLADLFCTKRSYSIQTETKNDPVLFSQSDIEG